jgi:hypothetical protein
MQHLLYAALHKHSAWSWCARLGVVPGQHRGEDVASDFTLYLFEGCCCGTVMAIRQLVCSVVCQRRTMRCNGFIPARLQAGDAAPAAADVPCPHSRQSVIVELAAAVATGLRMCVLLLSAGCSCGFAVAGALGVQFPSKGRQAGQGWAGTGVPGRQVTVCCLDSGNGPAFCVMHCNMY